MQEVSVFDSHVSQLRMVEHNLRLARDYSEYATHCKQLIDLTNADVYPEIIKEYEKAFREYSEESKHYFKAYREALLKLYNS